MLGFELQFALTFHLASENPFKDIFTSLPSPQPPEVVSLENSTAYQHLMIQGLVLVYKLDAYTEL